MEKQQTDVHLFPDSEIQDKLRGDAIGSTMYTQRFVLKTLLKLNDLDWNEELEEDLCFLWDSTVEKEVCDYLMDLNFPSIACGVISEYNTVEHGRLIEILVGILANITTAKCEKQLEAEQVETILILLASSDSLILVQVMRFVIAYSHNCGDLFSNIDNAEDIVQLFKFILKSSINFDLIQKTLEAVAKMTTLSKTTLFFQNDFIKIMVKACLRSITEDEEMDFEILTSEQRHNVKFLVEYILNICVYINNQENNLLQDNWSNIYLGFFLKLCEWYSAQENLLPLTDELLYYFEASNYIFSTLKVDYHGDILKNLFLILKILIDNKCEHEMNEFIEMCCYFIEKGDLGHVKLDLKSICSHDIEIVCQFLGKQKLNFDKNKLKLCK